MSGKFLLLHFTNMTRGIGALDVVRYSTANGAETFYLDSTRPVLAPSVQVLVHLDLENTMRPTHYPGPVPLSGCFNYDCLNISIEVSQSS